MSFLSDFFYKSAHPNTKKATFRSAQDYKGHGVMTDIQKQRASNPSGTRDTYNRTKGAVTKTVTKTADKKKAVEAKIPSLPKVGKPKAAGKKVAPAATKTTTKTSYPVYKKSSKKAASFRKAFASARKSGKKEFSWEGRKYNTKVKK